MTDDHSIMRGWPASLVRLAETVGVANTLRLVDAYGGAECHIPLSELHPGVRLVQVVGMDAAAAMKRVYGGGPLEIASLRIARTRKGLIAEADGTVTEIARRLGVTRRWVRMVRNAGQGGDPRQIDMFAAPERRG